MSYEVRSRDLSGISNSGIYAYDSYMKDQGSYYIKGNSTLRGYVLVKMKNVRAGVSMKFKLNTRGIWYWKPEISYRWKWDGFRFTWLSFSLNIQPLYAEVPDKIVGDHLGELVGSSLKGAYVKQSRFNFKSKIYFKTKEA